MKKTILFFVSTLLLFHFFSFQNNIPKLKMKLSETDTIGTIEEETCFGCGDCSVYCLLDGNFTLTSSSQLSSQGKNTYSIDNINDYNLKTAWVEGVKTNGVGEWIQFNFKTGITVVQLNGIYLFNGYRKDLKTWENNSRIKELKMIVNGNDYAFLELHDSYKYQSTDFPELDLKDLKTIRFEITEVHKGDKYSDVALSELKFNGIHHH